MIKHVLPILLFSWAIGYLIGVFSTSTFDITLWKESMRSTLAVSITFIGVVIGLARASNKYEKDK